MGRRWLTGCWVVHYHDGSAFTPFASELDALRHALDTSATVTWVPWGQSVSDAVKAADQRPNQDEDAKTLRVPVRSVATLGQVINSWQWLLVGVDSLATADATLIFERP